MAINTSTVTTIGRRPATGRASIIQDLRDAYGRWQERSRIRLELQQMSSRELADLGLSHSDIDDVANGSFRRGE